MRRLLHPNRMPWGREAALVPAIVISAIANLAIAQEDLPEGHSSHGEVFNDGPRQAAYLMPRPQTVHFPITSGTDEVQDFFDQGVGQLHGFWFFEAERSFRQVAMLDPDCSMAYWGLAMANVDNPERAKGFARVAWLKRGLVTKRERKYIDAIARFHDVDGPEEAEPEAAEENEDGKKAKPKKEDPKAGEKRRAEQKKRAERLVRDYEEIIWAYPDDVEAKAMLVNRLWLNRRAGLAISSRTANEALLNEVFATHPEHPAHHYRIHLWDEAENAEHVVDSAVRSGLSNPAIAHMWHMGGHIFARLGRHSDAAWQQEASARVDHGHMMHDHVLPDQIHNFAHNNEWLTRSMRHHGRVSDAIDLAKNMIELPRHPKYNRLDKRGCSATYGRQRLLEMLSMFERWEELVELSKTMYLEAASEATDRAELAYHLGIAHTFLDDGDGFDAARADLESHLSQLKDERIEALEKAESESVEDGGSSRDAKDEMQQILDSFASRLDRVRDKVASLDALQELSVRLDVDENLKQLEDHGFERAHLSRLYLEHDKKEKAEELARKAIERRDGQIYYHANLAYVLHELGETE
ncbi:MAG: hypothetical protein ACI841_004329, partial [Planctomycetota bacterium]